MRDLFKDYLFTKEYFVSSSDQDHSSESVFGSLMALGKSFGIVITKQANLADLSMVHMAETQIGYNVPLPFYRGFPQSVHQLSIEEKLADQLYSYFITYGMNDFEGEGTRSIFEEQIKRNVLTENTEPKYFEILTEKQAVDKLTEYVNGLLQSTRPLNISQYELVKEFTREYGLVVDNIASKNTTIKLLLDTRSLVFARYLDIPDVVKLVEELLVSSYKNQTINKLNLRNKDRKFITCIIRILATKANNNQMKECIEKRKIWKGLLHHLHFTPSTPAEVIFTSYIFDEKYCSNMAFVEASIGIGRIREACNILSRSKGATSVLRNMNYLLSRCNNQEDKEYVIEKAFETSKVIPLIQQLYNYYNYSAENKSRVFKFTKHNLLKVHEETQKEVSRRKSYITKKDIELVKLKLENKIYNMLSNKLGKVYIDDDMVFKAVPLQETTSNSGYGVLTRGSRVRIAGDDNKVVRLFTYWEKVNDIDLSVMGIDDEGHLTEFSWRTFALTPSNIICFSGDQTRGYNGGSEYIDVDLEAFNKYYPNIRYLVVCDNVYSGTPFDDCNCTAGYMLRKEVNSGEVFEPKTVKSSFLVKGNSTFSYLFAVDMKSWQLIWLNVIKDSKQRVAGEDNFDFLIPYIKSIDVFNLCKLFVSMTTKLVDNPEDADVIVSDNPKLTAREDQEIIHSTDVERIFSLLN